MLNPSQDFQSISTKVLRKAGEKKNGYCQSQRQKKEKGGGKKNQEGVKYFIGVIQGAI